MKTASERIMAGVIVAALCLLSFMFLSVASLQPSQEMGHKDLSSLLKVYAADAPYRNALYLYLRLAGVVWIAVEWIAAFLLWRTYRMVAKAIAEKRIPDGA